MQFVPAAVTARLSRHTALLQKSSPQILFAVGVMGVVGGTVLACRATLKMDEVLGDASKKIKDVENHKALGYTESHRRADLTLVKVQTGIEIVKVYTPAIIVTGLSIAALTSSHRILTSRNAALTAAYTTIDTAFRQYRARVVEKLGEQQDLEFRHGSEKIKIKQIGTGKQTTVTRVAPGGTSGYARFYDASCPDWERDPEYNYAWLKCQQNWLNDLLRIKGYVLLNDAYDRIGFPRTSEGAVVGWVLSNDGSTDNYIDFGIFDGETQGARDFCNGREGSVLVDFNVDGLIWDRINSLEMNKL